MSLTDGRAVSHHFRDKIEADALLREQRTERMPEIETGPWETGSCVYVAKIMAEIVRVPKVTCWRREEQASPVA